MLRVPDPSERLMLRLHYCKSRCVRPVNLFALSHVLFPLELFKRGNLTPAVRPLINVICSGLNRDHGTTRKESSFPSWIITNPLHSSFIPLDQPWPGYSTGFAFHPPFPFFSSPPRLSFLSCQSGQGKYSSVIFFSPHSQSCRDQDLISREQVSAFYPNHQGVSAWLMIYVETWRDGCQGTRLRRKTHNMFFLLDKNSSNGSNFFSPPKGKSSVPTDQPKARECDFSYDG